MQQKVSSPTAEQLRTSRAWPRSTTSGTVKAKYHSLLDSAPMSRNGTGRFGTDNRVYKAISTSILDEIARLYPDLSDAVETAKLGTIWPDV